MKKCIYFVFVVFGFFLSVNGQDSIKPIVTKKHLNEFGLDMTPFLKFYFNFSQNGGYYYPDNYFLTYRRYFKIGNIRAGIGGNYSYSEEPSLYNGDSLNINYYKKEKAIELRIGYEFFQNLSRRWQVYYGIDARAGYAYSKIDAQYWNGGYSNGIETKFKGIGLAPILGIRLKVNRRLSLLTESSFLVQYSENSTERYYVPVFGGIPYKPNDPKITRKSFNTLFNSPISVIVSFSL